MVPPCQIARPNALEEKSYKADLEEIESGRGGVTKAARSLEQANEKPKRPCVRTSGIWPKKLKMGGGKGRRTKNQRRKDYKIRGQPFAKQLKDAKCVTPRMCLIIENRKQMCQRELWNGRSRGELGLREKRLKAKTECSAPSAPKEGEHAKTTKIAVRSRLVRKEGDVGPMGEGRKLNV